MENKKSTYPGSIGSSQTFRNRFFFFCFLITGFPFSSFSQVDSVLSIRKFFETVAKNHPLVKQANLLQELATRELQITRGGFDPKLGLNFNRKSFEGKDYYNLFNPELKVPTWPGLDLKAGFERNVGTNISSEKQTPQAGLQYVGASLPLGKGLWTDVRRTAIKQAKVGLRMADAERTKEVNKILFSATKEYWEWYFCYNQLQLARMAYQFANERYLAVSQRVLVGEEAAIDSVEARIFQQDRLIFLNQAQVEEQNSRLQVSNYIWSPEGEPMEIQPGVTPDSDLDALPVFADSTINRLKEMAMAQHPEIRKIETKLEQLDLDQRLAKEMLKPQLNINYSWLSRVDNSIWATQTIDRNYKFGFDFGIPLLLRKERGKLGLTKTKLLQGRLELLQTQRNIRVEIQTNFNELKNLETLNRLQTQMVANYQRLRDGELTKFKNGESSLFLINSREQKLIEAQVKNANLKAKYQKEKAAVLYASGQNPMM